MGVLFKNAEASRSWRKIDTLVVDKTGTLTEGKPESDHVPADSSTRPRSCDSQPVSSARANTLGRCHRSGGRDGQWSCEGTSEFDSHRQGRQRAVEGASGGAREPPDDGRPGVDRDDRLVDRPMSSARRPTVMFVAVETNSAGLLGVADPIKASTPEAIVATRRAASKLILRVTTETTAEAVARKIGIDRPEARCFPSAKGEIVKELQEKAKWWPWLVTASTMSRHWRRRTWVSRWAGEPTWQCRARA